MAKTLDPMDLKHIISLDLDGVTFSHFKWHHNRAIFINFLVFRILWFNMIWYYMGTKRLKRISLFIWPGILLPQL